VLARYHLRPEAKFHNGDWLDTGVTMRRHIEAIEVEHIGKEANRWQEQFFLGLDPDAQIEYGMDQADVLHFVEGIVQACRDYDVRKVAERAGLDHAGLCRLLRGQTRPKPATLSRLRVAVQELTREQQEHEDRTRAVLDAVKAECQRMSVRQFAAQVGVDWAYLSRVLAGKGKASERLLAALERAVGTPS
jgi:transcriptional regulator with XRE-family HTH domain